MRHAENTFISSTFWTERIGPVAALKTLEIMKRSESWKKITNIGKKIQDQIRILSKKYDLDVGITGLPSLTNFSFNSKDNNKYIVRMRRRNLNNDSPSVSLFSGQSSMFYDPLQSSVWVTTLATFVTKSPAAVHYLLL